MKRCWKMKRDRTKQIKTCEYRRSNASYLLKVIIKSNPHPHPAMSHSSQDTYDKNHCEEEFDEENVTFNPGPSDWGAHHRTSYGIKCFFPWKPQTTSSSSADFWATLSLKDIQSSSSRKAVLPPIKGVSWKTLRDWCYHDLNTNGKKIEVYLRLQRHSYPKQKCYIPNTLLEAGMNMVPKKPKIVTKGSRPQENNKSTKREESGVVEVVTSPGVHVCSLGKNC